MTLGFFCDKQALPTESEVRGVLGEAAAFWDMVSTFAKKQGFTHVDWRFYTAKAGWCKKLLNAKQRNLAFLYPNHGYFTAVLVLGEKAVAVAENANIRADHLALMHAAKPYKEGRGFPVKVENAQDCDALLKLLDIKLAH